MAAIAFVLWTILVFIAGGAIGALVALDKIEF